MRVHKVLSTPAAPERAILQGISRARARPRWPAGDLTGSTVATNAVLEGKGARTAYVTNRGFADLLTIGRQARAASTICSPIAPPAPVPAGAVPRDRRALAADGTIVEPLTAADLADCGGLAGWRLRRSRSICCSPTSTTVPSGPLPMPPRACSSRARRRCCR
jgi:N-methylhydantoinase A